MATRRNLIATRTEASLHMEVVRFLRVAWPSDLMFWHTPNGGLRNKGEAGKLKAMGTLAGVPDLLFVLPGAQLAGIEIKAAGEDLTPEQVVFRDRLVALKGGFATCRSLDEVEATLARWLGRFTPPRQLRARTLPSGATFKLQPEEARP